MHLASPDSAREHQRNRPRYIVSPLRHLDGHPIRRLTASSSLLEPLSDRDRRRLPLRDRLLLPRPLPPPHHPRDGLLRGEAVRPPLSAHD